MDPKEFFKFCPKCAGDLEPHSTDNYLTCKVCHFKFFINTSAAAGAIIENKNGEILIVKRKYNPAKGEWDIPGGFVIGGETLEESVKREIKEELGVEIKIDKIIGVYPDTYLYQGVVIPLLNTFVSAKITSGEITPNDDAEEFKFVPKSEVLNYNLWCPSIIKAVKDYLKK